MQFKWSFGSSTWCRTSLSVTMNLSPWCNWAFRFSTWLLASFKCDSISAFSTRRRSSSSSTAANLSCTLSNSSWASEMARQFVLLTWGLRTDINSSAVTISLMKWMTSNFPCNTLFPTRARLHMVLFRLVLFHFRCSEISLLAASSWL